MDLSGSTFDTEKLQGYAIVLKQINGKNLTSFCLNVEKGLLKWIRRVKCYLRKLQPNLTDVFPEKRH